MFASADAAGPPLARRGKQDRIQEAGWRSRVRGCHPEEPEWEAVEACAEGQSPEPQSAAGCETLISQVHSCIHFIRVFDCYRCIAHRIKRCSSVLVILRAQKFWTCSLVGPYYFCLHDGQTSNA